MNTFLKRARRRSLYGKIYERVEGGREGGAHWIEAAWEYEAMTPRQSLAATSSQPLLFFFNLLPPAVDAVPVPEYLWDSREVVQRVPDGKM